MNTKAYKALYRQYRPNNFDEVRGQDHIVKTLKNIIENNKISHAYLFSGPRGTGKTSVAKIFATVLNCEHTQIKTQACTNCINNVENNLDIIEIDAASNTGIDDIRNLKENIKHLPTASKFKIYIIDEVHMLSKSAWNALLKTIEEPPKHVIFILATTDPQKIPVTVLSRVQRFNFRRIDNKIIYKQLQYVYSNEEIDFEPKALELIATLSNGAMRDALSMADQISIYAANKKVAKADVEQMFGLTSNILIIKLINLMTTKNIKRILEVTNNLIDNGADIERLITSCVNVLKDYLVYEKTQEKNLLTFSDADELKDLIISEETAYKYLDIFIEILKEIRYSDIPQQTLELGLLKLAVTETTQKQPQKDSQITEEFAKPSTKPEITEEPKQSSIQAQITEEFKKFSIEPKEQIITKPEPAVQPQIKNNRPYKEIDGIPVVNNYVNTWDDDEVVETDITDQGQNEYDVDEDEAYFGQANKSIASNNHEDELSEIVDPFANVVDDSTQEHRISEPETHEVPLFTTEPDYVKEQRLAEELKLKYEQETANEYEEQRELSPLEKINIERQRQINSMLDYDDIANDDYDIIEESHTKEKKVKNILEQTQEFAAYQNDITSEMTVAQEDLLNQDFSESDDVFGNDETRPGNDVLGIDPIIKESISKDITLDEIINMMLISQKEKRSGSTHNWQMIYKASINLAIDTIKDEEYAEYRRLLLTIKPILSTENFIIFATDYQDVVNIYLEFKEQPKFKEYIHKVFNKNICVFVVLKSKLQRANEYWRDHMVEIKQRQIKPIICNSEAERQQKSEYIEKSKNIFGEKFKIK